MEFQFKKKEKDKVDGLPKKKEIKTKGVKRVVLGGLVLVLFSGVGAFVKAGAVSTHVSKVENTVINLKRDVDGEDKGKILLTPELKSFMDRFVSEYINVPNDDAAFKERSQKLEKEFYAEGLAENDVSFSATRQLKSSTFVSLKKVDGVPVASYQVEYEIETPVTKKIEEKHKDKKGKETTTTKEVTSNEKVDSTQVLNVPFIMKDGAFCVAVYPYFTEPVTVKAKEKAISYNAEKLKPVNSDTEDEVQKFVEDFLTKYCESSSSDMAYMMDSPEGLNGSFSLDQVELKTYKGENSLIVKADVTLKDKNTSLLQKEQLTLHLIKKSDKYYVKKLSHTWKESE